MWLDTPSSAVQESRLYFSGKFARLTHRVKHSEFFFPEVLPRCDIFEEVFLGKIKEPLDAVNSELSISDIASVVTIVVSY